MSSAPATRVFCDSRGLATATSSGSNVACTCEFCGAGASWRCSMKSVGVVGPEKANFRVFKEVACGCAPCRFGRPWKCKAKRAAGGGGGPIAGPQKYFAKSAADAVRIARGLPEAKAAAAPTPIRQSRRLQQHNHHQPPRSVTRLSLPMKQRGRVKMRTWQNSGSALRPMSSS
jgi:hypothetical protein